MSLSRQRNRERMRAIRGSKKAQGTVMLPKALIRKLRATGIDPSRYLTVLPVSLADYRDLERRLEMKIQRVEWQSSGIATLRAEVETLKANDLERQAQIDLLLKRQTLLEADMALRDATAHSNAGGLYYGEKGDSI